MPVYPVLPSVIYKFFNPLLILIDPCIISPAVCGISPVAAGTMGPA